jgi:MinD-like ATPase involved in chromosome partitioning or flagellar assembly
MELIAFASGKGGTGKTLMASCLGYSLVRAGHRVLMIDADPATDGLSLFLLGRDGMRQVGGFSDLNTFSGALREFQKSGVMKCEPRGIHRSGSDEQGDHGVSYQAIISGKWIYGDEPAASDAPVVPDIDQAGFRKAVAALFASVKAADQYDYVIVDTRGGFAFESTDVCALADSFIVITEPDVTSFYQDRNLVKRISDAAKQVNSRPLLRSIIINKASEGDSKDGTIDLQKLETSFRLELEKEFPVKFLDTHPVPIDLEAFKAYKTQRIPYLAAPASLFAFATLSAFRDILQIVTSRWTETQVQQWNALVETISAAIAARNQKLQAERELKAEREKQMTSLQTENQALQQRVAALSKEMDRLEHRYERELERTTVLLSQIPPAATPATGSVPQAAPMSASAPSAPAPQVLPTPRSVSGRWRVIALVLLLSVVTVAAIVWYWRRGGTGESMLQDAYNESQPISSRVSNLRTLSQKGQKDFDGIKLPGANLSELNLDHASFRSAVLKSAAFRKTDLRTCDLSGADLNGADLTDANLSGCSLRNTDLTQADLTRTDLRGADLTGANVLPDQVNQAITDTKTMGVQVNAPSANAPVNVPPNVGVANRQGSNLGKKPRTSLVDDSIPVIPPQKPGTVILFFDNWNKDAVQNSPSRPTRFAITQPYTVTDIADYHWNYGSGARPRKDSITLRRLDGTAESPPCYVQGVGGQGDVPNAAWECHPNMTIGPGVYEVVDSSPSTWSQNNGSGNRGFSRVTGFVIDKAGK